MSRYVAFLRGVSPMNCKMPELKRCLEAAGFSDVKTVASTGNAAFTARAQSTASLEKKVEAATAKHLGRTFQTVVRSSAHLQEVIERAPFGDFDLPADAKHIVTFLKTAPGKKIRTPLEKGQSAILEIAQTEAYSAYWGEDQGTSLMALLDKTFGKDITSRTLGTVRKCAAA
jgi:uncharacterized protein (DUF1697 family)